MRLCSEMRGSDLLITVEAGRIDAAAAIRFKDEMRRLTDGGSGRVVLDLGRVEFIDSSGLGAIVAAMKTVGAERRLELAALTPQVRKVFELTHMDTVFTIHASPGEAFAGLQHAS